MAAGEEEPDIQEQVDEGAASQARDKEQQAKNRARLVSINENEPATPGQIDDMMSSSFAAASSGYDAGPFTGAVPAIVQEFEDLTTSNLRGSRHRRMHSVDSTTSTVASVADAIQQESDDVRTVVQIATQLKFILSQRKGEGDVELAGVITTLILQLTTLKANGRYEKAGLGQHLYTNAQQRLVDIMEAEGPSL